MRRPTPRAAAFGALAALGAAAPAALGQEATNTPAATQPSVGSTAVRLKLQYQRLSGDPSPADREVDKAITDLSITHGLARTLSLTLDLPLTYERVESEPEGGGGPGGRDDTSELGLEDFTLTAKWRFWQRDLGPVDSLRAAVIAGVELPSGDTPFSSHSVDPVVGGVFTAILGRHGVNQSLRYKFNTSGEGNDFPLRPGDGHDDALFFDTSYLFRLAPAEYGAETTAATYLTLELNGLYETGGDTEVLLGPGLLYEARTFALEAAVGLPVYQEVDERPEQDLVVTLGVRFLF